MRLRELAAASCVALIGFVGSTVSMQGESQPGRFAVAQASPSSPIVEICTGKLHSCSRAEDGTVACWGDNERHQIGGATPQIHEPQVVAELGKAVSLRCGTYRTCIATASGQVRCLGKPDGAVATVALPGRAREFIVHDAGGCAILDNATVACWQGDGETTLVATDAAGAKGFAMSTADAERVCVLRSPSAPICFNAALWSAQPEGARSAPPPRISGVEVVDDLAEARQLVLLKSGLCGWFGDGGIRCQPDILAARLGQARANRVIAATADTLCVRTDGRKLHCMNASDDGVPGPLRSGIPPEADQIAFSHDHACALLEGRVTCWGKASHGQLGDGTQYLHAVPVRVPGIDDAVALRAAEGLACAARDKGTLSCWGTLDDTPSDFPGFLPAEITSVGRVLDVYVGTRSEKMRLCAKGRKGWRCFFRGKWVSTLRAPGPSGEQLRRGGVHLRRLAPDGFCGVDAEGRIACGHCGVCSPAEVGATLTRISWSSPFLEVSSLVKDRRSGDVFFCARTKAKKAVLVRSALIPFVHDSSPQVLDESTVAGLDQVEQVAALGSPQADASLICTLARAGSVHCLGEGQYGQLGIPKSEWRWSAAPIASLPPVVEIAVGGTFACARTKEGHVYCWGSNRDGAVPDGAPGERKEPVSVRTLPQKPQVSPTNP